MPQTDDQMLHALWSWVRDDGDPLDLPADLYAKEYAREQAWTDLEEHARDFVATYGAAAMLRCVSRAVE